MAYRDDAADGSEAPTAEGKLRAELAPRHVRLAIASRSIEISDAFATVIEHHRKHPRKDRRTSLRIAGRLIVARDVPHDGLGLWLELAPGTPSAGVRRLFGVEPVSLLEPDGLAALAALDRLAQRVRHELAHLAPDVTRALEIGSPASGGVDKVLVVDHGDRCCVFARRLFRDRARLAMTVHDDGRIVVPSGGGTREVTVRSRHGVTVVGDYIRFADPSGADLAKVAFPWIRPEYRDELAHRFAQRIDRERAEGAAWPPRLPADRTADRANDLANDRAADLAPDPAAVLVVDPAADRANDQAADLARDPAADRARDPALGSNRDSRLP